MQQQEATLTDRLAVASALILQSPPGEVNDVFNDVRPIVGDDSELERGLLPALAQYNTEQLALVEIANGKVPAIICEAARIGGSAPAASSETRFLDPHSQQTFAFDHLRLAASDFAPFTPPDPAQEDARAQLDLHAETYVKNHYQNAAWSVFSVPLHHPSQHSHQPVPASENPPRHSLPHDDAAPDALSQEPADQPGPDEAPLDTPAVPDPIDEPGTETQHPTTTTTTSSPSSSSHQFKLYIVGNKYNPTNYWTGRWRSIYEIDMETGKVRGEISVNVHYYEQGNVQLSTTHTPEMEVVEGGKRAGPQAVMEAIQKAESGYQAALNNAYAHLGDHTFKLLRRALPVTKQKVNWNNLKSRIVLDDH